MRPAYIIGHGPGVGDAVARAFAATGHPVALFARGADRVATAAAAIGNTALGFATDAADEVSLSAALESAKSHLGPPGIVVYNAALWRPGPVLGMTPDQLLGDLRIDVGGALVASRWAAPLMQPGDALLFTGGGLALYPSPQAPSLSIGKGAIRALALMLAEELAGTGIRVGTITIAGIVGSPGLSPERIADAFVELATSENDDIEKVLSAAPPSAA